MARPPRAAMGAAFPTAVICCGRARRAVGDDRATWYFVRHGEAAAAGASPAGDSAQVLTQSGRAALAAQRKGWLQAEGLHQWMLDEELEVPGRFVASSPAPRCLETATALLSMRALHIAPVPYIQDGLSAKSPAFSRLWGKLGNAPLRDYLQADTEGVVMTFARLALRELYELLPPASGQDCGDITTVLVFGHAVGLAAIALELAELRGIAATDAILDARQAEATAFKVSLREAAYLA